MKLFNAVFCGGLIWLLTVPALHADNQSNPFQSITDRNVFALRPPPPPPSNEPPPGPPPQLAKVVLTGLTSLFGPNDKRAFLEIEETDGKGKNIQKPIMREGERNGSVEVLRIVEMLCGMTPRRRITTPDVPANQALAQMHPLRAFPETILASVGRLGGWKVMFGQVL